MLSDFVWLSSVKSFAGGDRRRVRVDRVGACVFGC